MSCGHAVAGVGEIRAVGQVSVLLAVLTLLVRGADVGETIGSAEVGTCVNMGGGTGMAGVAKSADSGAAVGAERASDWRMGGYGQSWYSVECAAVEVSVAGEVFAAGDKT